MFASKGKTWKNGIVLHKVIFDDKKGFWKWNLWCTPVKALNMDTDQHVCGDKRS